MATQRKPKDEGEDTPQKSRSGVGNTVRSLAFAGGTAVAAMGAIMPAAQAQSWLQQMLPGAIQELQGVLRQPAPPAYYPPAGQENGYEQRRPAPHHTRVVRRAEPKTHVERVAKANISPPAIGAVPGAAVVAQASQPMAMSYPDLDSPNLSVTLQRLGDAQPTQITVAQANPLAQGTDTAPARILLNGKMIKELNPNDFSGVVLLQGPVLMPGEPYDLGKPSEVNRGDPAYVLVMGDPGPNSCASQTDAKKAMVIALSGESPTFSPPFDVCVKGTPEIGIRSDGKIVVPTDTLPNGKTKVVVYGGKDDYSEQVISSSQGQSASR